MKYISSVDGSPATFIASIMYKTVTELHPDEHLPVVCGMQHQFRKALGKPFSHLCHVNIVPIEYPMRLRNVDMMKLNTMTRGRLIIGTDDENDKLTINQHIGDDKLIRTMSFSQKHDYMRKVMLDGIGRNTYEVSYAGNVPWSGLDRYITDFSPYIDMTLSGGISVEVFSIKDEFCFNIMQRNRDISCFTCVCDILKSLSIPFTTMEPTHFEICRFRMPD